MTAIHLADLFSKQISNIMRSEGNAAFKSGNQMSIFASDPFEGSPSEWARDIFLGLNNEFDDVHYQKRDEGDNRIAEDLNAEAGVQYTGEGNNDGVAEYLTQFTDEGNNIGKGTEMFQYTSEGTNTAFAQDDDAFTFQYNEKGDNVAGKSDEVFGNVKQYTAEGNNTAFGETVSQYTGEGNNTATGTGEDSYITQNTEDGENTATNAQYINQSTVDGKNTATGTDEDDTIIQRGGVSTATGKAGDDQIFLQESEEGDATYTVDGGEGDDTIHLYGNRRDWEKTTENGNTVYTNEETGDKVVIASSDTEYDVEFGEEPPVDSPDGAEGPDGSDGPDNDGGDAGDDDGCPCGDDGGGSGGGTWA